MGTASTIILAHYQLMAGLPTLVLEIFTPFHGENGLILFDNFYMMIM